MTLPALIDAAARGSGFAGPDGWITFVQGDDHERRSWNELHSDARAVASALQARGIGPGDHVAVLGPTSRALVTAVQATWLTGASLVMLPLPMRMASIEAFVDQTRARVAQADASVVLMDEQLVEFIEPTDGDPPFVRFDELAGDEADFEVVDIDPDSMAVLQFTSGSTSDPKGVMLSHRAICHNVEAARVAAALRPDDVLVSWLPLYHDMGLIGLLCIPMTTGLRLVLGAPQDFMAKPIRWMEWISTFRGTCTVGPNFAFVLAARALRRADGLDLSTMRTALSGAEPVDAESFRNFAAEAGRFGFPESALFPAFGMAEVCIAGTFPVPGDGLVTDVIDGRVLEHERYAAATSPESPNARELAVLGRPVAGLEIRVVDPTTRNPCRDREVGELLIRGNSLTSGYYKRPDATAEAIVDGWLRTGDLAYTVDGELVMCGRIKDVIIIGGRNIYPQDVEKVVGDVDGVRKGNVVAFAQDGRNAKQHIVVVAETRLDEVGPLRNEITKKVLDEIGVPPRDVVLVPPGTVPKTSSGKLQRSACRQLFEQGALGGSG
ncbi:MAG TPA: fatty acyl-AMP ligase, partial [Microthrixaceae bacterium]|nr:fatty acyl-AMP ligase [Microthrixaceae bacterium]